MHVAKQRELKPHRRSVHHVSPSSNAQAVPSQTNMIQRKSGCACGGSCAECQNDEPNIQRKAVIGPANDRYEQEADRVAEQVMRASSGVTSQSSFEEGEQYPQTIMRKPLDITPLVQREPQGKMDEEDETNPVQMKARNNSIRDVSTASPSLDHRLAAFRQGGKPLPENTRQFFESRMGYDFSNVRIHQSAEAANLNRDINAKAFTMDRHIVFGQQAYSPSNDEGKKLLAHELTHVVQQNAPEHISRKPLTPISRNDHDTVQRAVSKELAEIEDLLSYGVFDWKIFDSEAIRALELLKKLSRYQQAVFVSSEPYAGRLRDNLPGERIPEYDAIVASVQSIAPSTAKNKIKKIESLLSYSIVDWAITDAEAIQALDLLKSLSGTELTVALGTVNYGRLMDNLPDDRKQELIDLLSSNLATGAARDQEEKSHPGSVLTDITFTSDHGVLKDNNKTWAPGGSLYSEPEWSRDNKDKIISKPITHSMGKNVQVNLSVNAVPATATAAPVHLKGESRHGFLSFNHTGTMQGGVNATGVISSNAAIPDGIRHIQDEEIVWRLKWRGWEHEIGRSRHDMFVTMNNPLSASEVTLKRMLMAIGIVEPLATVDPHEIVRGIMRNWNRYNLAVPLSTTGWEWIDNFTNGAQCIDIVRFVNGVLTMIGSPGTVEAVVVWAKPDAPATPIEELWTDIGCRETLPAGGWTPGTTHCALHKPAYAGVGLIDGDWKLNAFEAALKFNHGGSLAYYPGGVDSVMKSPDEVLNVFKCLARFSGQGGNKCKIEHVYADYKYGPCPVGAVKKCWY